MLDRVIRLEPGRAAAGLKAVSAADIPVSEGSPTAPALPGSLVLHGLCVLAEAVLDEPGERPAILEAAEEATFLKAARPGQVLTYAVDVVEAGKDEAVLIAEATLDGEPAVRARLRYRRRGDTTADPLAAGWRGLQLKVLSGEPPPILR
jgi:3-hydroxymyristoyl/3-hydroxydecanoyl-(acyl carrier protein) dehydratase